MVINGKRNSKQQIISGIVLLLTVSMVLSVWPSFTQTETINELVQPQQLPQVNIKSVGTSLWSQTYGGLDEDGGRWVEQTADGGYIIVGWTMSYGAGQEDVLLIKTDENGEVLWNKTYGLTGNDIGWRVQQTVDGGYIVTGLTNSFGAGGYDVWLIKTDKNGNHDWNKTYGGIGDDFGFCVKQIEDEEYIIVGRTDSFGAGGNDVWLIKTRTTGVEHWNKTFGGGGDDEGISVEETAGDFGYIITGYTRSFGSEGGDVWLIKTNSDGIEEWNQTYGGMEEDIGWWVEQTSDEGYIIAGHTNSSGAGNLDLWLIKTNSTGDEEWNQTYGGTDNDTGRCVYQTSDGGYILTAYTKSFGAGDYDVWLIKTDEHGSHQWNRTYGGLNDDRGPCVRQTSDEGYIIAGPTNSFGFGGYDVWLIKTDLAGSGAPIIDNPPDISYEEGSVGFNITWNPSDVNPLNYTVTRNDLVVDSSPWDGSPITVNVEGLEPGTYNYTCTVFDTAGNSSSDSVIVKVKKPFNWLPILIVLIFGIVAASIFYKNVISSRYRKTRKKVVKKKTKSQ